MCLFFYFIRIFIAAFQPDEADEPVRVAVAANAQYAMREIAAAFENVSGEQIELVISSSGKLTAQIKSGAPYDIFLSADMNYPDELYRSGYAVDKPEIYGYGTLVFCFREKVVKNIADLEKFNEGKIAIANPQHAPYGEAAIETLKHYKIYDKVKDQLIYGESISQVNQYLHSGSAEFGFTSKSVVILPEMDKTGYWLEVDPSAYTPIHQGVVLLKSSGERNEKLACEFYRFLFSPQAKSIFVKYGYHFPQ